MISSPGVADTERDWDADVEEISASADGEKHIFAAAGIFVSAAEEKHIFAAEGIFASVAVVALTFLDLSLDAAEEEQETCREAYPCTMPLEGQNSGRTLRRLLICCHRCEV